MDKEFTYRALFDQYAKPGEKFDEEWIEGFDGTIVEEGDIVGSHSWNSGNPGAGADMTLVYHFRGLFFTSDDFGIDGPYEKFSEAAEAVNLLTVTPTEEIWVDDSMKSDSEARDDDDDDEHNVQRRLAN